MAAAAAAVWLAGDVYDVILGPGPSTDAGGYWTLVSRVALGVAAALSLSTYDAVVRGPDRIVLELHPVLPLPWLHACLHRLVVARSSYLIIAWIALTPLLPDVRAFVLAALAVAGAWVAGIGVGLGVNLTAPAFGTDRRFEWLLDGIRGANPRLQAALLYAPGVALAGSGAAALAGTWGAARLLDGHWDGGIGLLTAPLVAVGGWLLARRSSGSVAGIGAVLGEIDAAWAGLDQVDESRISYLEWTLRFAPPALRTAMLKDMRHLWRGERPWVSGSWVLAVLVGVAAWTPSASGADRLLLGGAAAIGLVGFVGVRLGATDPRWLDAQLHLPHRRIARTAVLFLALQPMILAGVLALGVRQGMAAFAPFIRLELLAGAVAALASAAGYGLRAKGGLIYVPVAIVALALGAAR